jgi:hypothetical protein
MSVGICIIEAMREIAKTPEQIVNYLIGDITEMIETRKELNENDLDGYYDYLSGIIDRSQTILRMLGIPEELIPTEFGVDELA